MHKVLIKVIKKIEYKDLIEEYENKIENACCMNLGDEFISINCEKPNNLCDNAWISLYPYVFALANGATNLHDGWMKNPKSAIVSCNDGVRPVSFLLEVIE